MSIPSCPRCQSNTNVRMLSTVAKDATTPTELGAQIAAPPSPGPQEHQIGCLGFTLSTVLATVLGVGAALIAEFVAVTTGAPGRNAEEATAGLLQNSAFTGIVAFMFGFVAIFSFFVWRHVQASVRFSLTAERWRRARQRWEHLHLCSGCNGAFIAAEGRWFPVDLVQSYLREDRQPVAQAAPEASPSQG